MPPRDLVESRAHQPADLLGPLPERRLGQRIEHCAGGCARDRVPAEGPAQPSGLRCVHQLRLPGHRRKRKPAAESLAGNEQVRLDADVRDRPEWPRPPAAGLHLVGDVQDAVPVAEPPQRADELLRHRDEATLALHGLEHDARDRLGREVLLQQQLDPRERVLGRDAAVRVRRGRAVNLGRERREALLVDELGRHRHCQVRAAVEGAVEDDHPRPAGGRAGDLDGVLDRLRP